MSFRTKVQNLDLSGSLENLQNDNIISFQTDKKYLIGMFVSKINDGIKSFEIDDKLYGVTIYQDDEKIYVQTKGQCNVICLGGMFYKKNDIIRYSFIKGIGYKIDNIQIPKLATCIEDNNNLFKRSFGFIKVEI